MFVFNFILCLQRAPSLPIVGAYAYKKEKKKSCYLKKKKKKTSGHEIRSVHVCVAYVCLWLKRCHRNPTPPEWFAAV